MVLTFVLAFQFSRELKDIWNRNDIWGKLLRPLLLPPIEAENIEKFSSHSILRHESLGPRINLRFLAAYKSLALIMCSLFIGYLFFGGPGVGFFLLSVLALVNCYLRAALLPTAGN